MSRIVSRGVTLTSALILFTLLAVASLAITQMFSSHSKGTARLDRTIRGDQVLTTTASAYQQLDYDLILKACNAQNAFAGPVPSTCLLSGKINPARGAVTGQTYDLLSLAVLRGVDGEPMPAPGGGAAVTGNIFCIELNQCKSRAGGHLVEVTLLAYWPDSSPTGLTQSRAITFRRTRW